MVIEIKFSPKASDKPSKSKDTVVVKPNIPTVISARGDLQHNTFPVIRNFINGQFADEVSTNQKFMTNKNPSTGDSLPLIVSSEAADVDVAVEAAHSCYKRGVWKSMNNADRASILERLADLIKDHAHELAILESKDTGKPIQSVWPSVFCEFVNFR